MGSCLAEIAGNISIILLCNAVDIIATVMLLAVSSKYELIGIISGVISSYGTETRLQEFSADP